MRGLSLFCAALVGLGAAAAQAETCKAPPDLHDGWAVAAPDKTGIDPEVLCPLGQRFDEWKAADLHAVVVVRGGDLVYERYFTGDDQILGRAAGRIAFGPTTRHDLGSISETIVSLLVGIALDRGWIADIDTSTMTFFPEYDALRTPQKDRITLRDLLTMSSGFDWDESLPYSDPANRERGMDQAADPYRYILSQPTNAEHGHVFSHCGCSAVLLEAILKKASGKPLDVLARDELFAPLGIADVEWMRFANGDPLGHAGLRMRPRDLAKIGQLVLAKGVWRDKKIVSEKWIEEMTTARIGADGMYFYGYLWWLGRSLVSHHPSEWSAGLGWGGQRLYVVPKQDLVAVTNAGLYQSPLQGQVPETVLNRYILAATSGH
jgi:CubicO group peptidase (beta-lactamase class C family)